MRTFRKARWIVVAGVLAAVAASVSYAAIPSLNGTISACLDAKGTLKVIDVDAGGSCAANNQLLAWNQTGPQGNPGPQGQQGAQGAQGEQGPQGAPGPSDAYFRRVADVVIPGLYLERTIATVDLPAGKYVILASVRLHNPLAWMKHKCSLTAGTYYEEQEVETGIQVNQVKIVNIEGRMTWTTAHEFASPETVSLKCSSLSGQTLVKRPVITAIKVGKLFNVGVFGPS